MELTARRWTSEDLDAARHAADLVPRDRVWLNVDLAQHGLGSGACGPAVLPQHRLEARAGGVRVRAAPAARLEVTTARVASLWAFLHGASALRR